MLILLANAAARFMLPLKASHRTLLTLLEFSLGFVIASFSHLSAHLFASCKNDKFGPFDFFMKPVEIWKPTFARMPEGSRRLCGMAWGLTAIFAAILVMGGFDFDSIFDDWGFEKYEAPNVVKEVTKQARKKRNSKKDLADAVKDFAGEGDLQEAEAPPLETQCVILGYTLSDAGELNSVVLASAPRGRLSYVGLLSQSDIPEENRAEVLSELQSLEKQKSCYVKRDVPLKKAIWVEPKVLCLVQHKAWTSQYRLQKPSFLNLIKAEESAQTESTP